MSSADHSDKSSGKQILLPPHFRLFTILIVISVITGMFVFYEYSQSNKETTHSYFMRYYDDSFPTQIRSLNMNNDFVTQEKNTVLRVELTDGQSNDNSTYLLSVTPQHIARDGDIYWEINPFEQNNISFEHKPRQTFDFVISGKRFTGACMTENMIVTLFKMNDTSNGVKGGHAIDSEIIPIISQYPKGDARLCY